MAWQGKYNSLYINGQWLKPESTEEIRVISPTTEQQIAQVPAAGKTDMDRAVAAARVAFDQGPWPRMTVSERIAVLSQISSAMLAQEQMIAELVTTEMGCPITLSRQMQSANPRILLDSFLDIARSYEWSSVRHSSTGHALVTREPVGVVAAIVPWNVPLLATIIKIVPALLAGCTVVLKPSPEAPLSSYLLASIFESSWLPPGVVNIVPAEREVSEYLVTHPDVDKVSFTGSTLAGRRIAALCGQDLRRVTLELGGKSAAVVLDDADLDFVVEKIRVLSMRNNGQTCSNKTRIVVPRTLEDELKDRLVAMVDAMPVGDPFDPATQIGPLVTDRQRDRVEGYIEIGRQEGAKVLVGGGRPAGLERGWYVEPTIFTEVDPSMRIAQEEIFGPVLSLLSYDSDDDAVAIANNSVYGLSGSVFSSDEERGVAVARRLRTGTVELNGNPVGWHAPVGGFKDSGIGREAGPEGIEAFVETRSIGITAEFAKTLD